MSAWQRLEKAPAYRKVFKACNLKNGSPFLTLKHFGVQTTEEGMLLSTIQEVAVLRHLENSSTRSWLFHRENGDQGETRPRQKESAIPSCKNRRMKSFWGRHMSAGKTSSQNCNITNHMKNRNKLEDMKFYIRKINAERLELFRILDIDMNTDLNYRMNIEFTIIKSQHEKTMLDMEKITQSINDTIEKYKEFIEDKDSYSFMHTYLLKECNQLKEKVRMLLNENRKLLVEQADQEASYGEENRFCDESSKNIHPKY
uniref:Predicted gene 5799 n=3 Tax=Mus musculus TaxID=10090 RepID=A0AA74KSN8_MOUSE